MENYKIVLTDDIDEIIPGSTTVVINCSTEAERAAVKDALRWLPSYQNIERLINLNHCNIMVYFKGGLSAQIAGVNSLVNDIESVQAEVARWRKANNITDPNEEQPTSQSGQFVSPQTGNPAVTETPAPGIVTTVQETIEKYDAKTILFWGLVITALILILKK